MSRTLPLRAALIGVVVATISLFATTGAGAQENPDYVAVSPDTAVQNPLPPADPALGSSDGAANAAGTSGSGSAADPGSSASVAGAVRNRSALPMTGSEVLQLVVLGAVVLVGGLALVGVGRNPARRAR